MLDLAGAIRRQLKNKTPPPADSADVAETAQPRASAPADDLRITAEVTAEKASPATIRNHPQTPKNSQTYANTGLQGFIRKSAESADAVEKKPERASPDAVLLADQSQPATIRAPENGTSYVQRMKAWKPARDAMINHLMDCSACYAPRARYCAIGAELCRFYLEAFKAASEPDALKP